MPLKTDSGCPYTAHTAGDASGLPDVYPDGRPIREAVFADI